MIRLRLYSGVALLLVAAMLAGCSADTEPADSRGVDPDTAVVAPTSDFTDLQVVSGGRALGLIMAESHADKIVEKYAITVTGTTEILGLNGEPVGFEDLEVTQQVKVWFSGPVKESFPMQVDAGRVVISR